MTDVTKIGCLFSVANDPDMGVVIALTPVDFWKTHGHMSDEYHDTYDLMETIGGVDMEQESIFSTMAHTKEEITEILLELGFEQDPDFDAFLAQGPQDE